MCGASAVVRMAEQPEVGQVVIARVSDVVDFEPFDAAAELAVFDPSACLVSAFDGCDACGPVDGSGCAAS